MKEKTAIKIFATLLTVVMLMSAVPLSGLSGGGLFSTTASASVINPEDSILTFKVEGNNAIVIGCDSTASGDIVIPSTFNDYAVTEIADNAFYGCTKITGITVPKGVTRIGVNAFYKCTVLSTINLPSGITSIGKDAFLDTKYYSKTTNNLGNWIKTELFDGRGHNYYSLYVGEYLIKVVQDTRHYCSFKCRLKDGTTLIADSAFLNCDDMLEVENTSSLKYIGNDAFSGCNYMSVSCVTGNVVSVGDRAFYNCKSISYETIPNSVLSVGEEAYKGCNNLKKVTILGDITHIKKGTFMLCTKLTEFSIPNSVTNIEDFALWGCSSLTKLVIPNGVKSIGNSAFSNLSNSIKVLYCGTEIEWDSIEKSQIGITDDIVTYNHDKDHLIGGQLICEPTCTEKGLISSKKCKICGKEIVAQIELPENGHTKVIDGSVSSTCTESGLTEGSHCSVCDTIIAAQEAIPATGHTFGEWVVVSSATTEKEGLEERICHCGEKETRSIPKINLEVVSVKLNTKSVDTNYNCTFKLTPNIEISGNIEYTVEYSSSNPNVATVDADGNVKTTGKGTATITVTVTDSSGNVLTDTCNVNVKFNFGQWLLYIICFGWIWM